jgi:Na+-translocating ferredoxin:NAD+ oxidoreductase subunit B
MRQDLFPRLQERLDHDSMGFPATESAIELRILRHLFSEEHVEMFLSMTHREEERNAG